jgi:hypothetical protein
MANPAKSKRDRNFLQYMKYPGLDRRCGVLTDYRNQSGSGKKKMSRKKLVYLLSQWHVCFGCSTVAPAYDQEHRAWSIEKYSW